MQKFFCYVDETGQDTQGSLFVVAAVITGPERERARDLLRHVEQESGKGHKKWTKATRRQRSGYMERVLQAKVLPGQLFYARFSQTTDYLPCVLHTVAQALTAAAGAQQYQVTVLIDGLRKEERPRVRLGLRQLGVAAKKIRGLRDESDEFIRLADATAGFVRDYLEGHADVHKLYQESIRTGVIQEV